MTFLRTIPVVLFVSLVLAATAAAQPTDQLSQVNALVEDGTRVAVTDSDGVETTGHFERMGASGLRLRLSDQTVEIPSERIQSIRRDGDPLWNGVFWGALWASAVALSYVTHVDCQTCSAWEAASVFLVLGGGGAGLGGLLDRRRHDRSVVFQRSSPSSARVRALPGPGPRGIRFSATWRF